MSFVTYKKTGGKLEYYVLADVQNDGLLFVVAFGQDETAQKCISRDDVEADLAANPSAEYLGVEMNSLKAVVGYKREEIEFALLQLPTFRPKQKASITKNDRWFLNTKIRPGCARFKREIRIEKRRKFFEGQIDTEMAQVLLECGFVFIGDIVRESYHAIKDRAQFSIGQMCELTLVIRLNGFDFGQEIKDWEHPIKREPVSKKKGENQELLDLPLEKNCLMYKETRHFKTGEIQLVTQRIGQETAEVLLKSGYFFIGDLVLSSLAEISERSGLSTRQVAHISRILHHFKLWIGMKIDWQRPS